MCLLQDRGTFNWQSVGGESRDRISHSTEDCDSGGKNTLFGRDLLVESENGCGCDGARFSTDTCSGSVSAEYYCVI
jgi:hypothetical protein